MKIGCPHGCMPRSTHPYTELHGLTICMSFSMSGLDAAWGRFADAGVAPKYCHVNKMAVAHARQILYGWCVAQGLKDVPLTLITDPQITGEWYDGWLVTDEFPEGGEIVEWDYIFPNSVVVDNAGHVEAVK